MTMYYSKSTGGFYDSEIHDVLPEDAVEITKERYIELMNAQGEGKNIVAGADGAPVAADVAIDPAVIIEAKKQKVRALREQVLDRLAGIAGRASRKGDTALAEACDAASEALLDITRDLPSEPDAVEQTLIGRYLLIREAAVQAAPSLELAFAQVDA